MQIFDEYLNAINSISENDKEHIHRSVLQRLPEQINGKLATTYKDSALGYIENKYINVGLAELIDKSNVNSNV